jgi:hypothetical protein
LAKVQEIFDKSKFTVPAAQTVKLFFPFGTRGSELKKIINRLNFLAIHVTELQLLLSIKPIIQTLKLYTLTDIGIFIKPTVEITFLKK